MGIVIYQVVIFGIIFIAALGGRKPLNRTTLALCLWTLTHVFMPWLLGIQFVTIGIAFAVGRAISKPEETTQQGTQVGRR